MRVSSPLQYLQELEKLSVSHFLVCTSCPFERKRIVDQTKAFLEKKQTVSLSRFSGDVKISEIHAAMGAQSLFGDFPLVIVDDLSDIPSKQISELASGFHEEGAFFIGGASSAETALAFEKKVTLPTLILDLTKEKPWEKEKRYKEYFQKRLMAEKVLFSSKIQEAFFSMIPMDFALIYQELEKLICFVGERKKLEMQDLEAICSLSKQSTSWQVAESIFMEETPKSVGDEEVDASFLLTLIPAIRYHVRICKKISLLQEQGSEDISSYFPSLYRNALEKKITFCQTLKKGFFTEVIHLLFSLENMAKDGAAPLILFHYLSFKLAYLKRKYAKKHLVLTA